MSGKYLRFGLIMVILLGFATLAYVSMTSGTSGGQADVSSITSVQNDAVADYSVASESGKPVYVLFHSLTCEPCIEISAVADEVVPEFEDRVEFVNAITDSPSGRQLSSSFQFQYIPTSFFLTPGGEVILSHTGTLSAEEMRSTLESLLES